MGATDSLEGCISLGPWGGSQGQNWIYMPEGFIKKISVRYGEVIDSIVFERDCSNGETESSFYGGKGGDRTNTICIDYPDEYLVSISGTISSYQECDVVVMSVCFETNKMRYGPYGTNSGNYFSYEGKGGLIVGFHGHVGKYLSAVGVYVMPKSLALARNSTCEGKIMHELCSSMSRIAMPRDAGPWGAHGGKPWDDGVFSNVKQIRIRIGEALNVICALQFEYVKRDAKSVLSQIHGGTDGDKIELVNLDGTDEYFTGISGFYGRVDGYNGLEAIASITFHTNKTIHGPYGRESGTGYASFTSTAFPGKIVGFHGRNCGFLSAIGVHMEYF